MLPASWILLFVQYNGKPVCWTGKFSLYIGLSNFMQMAEKQL